jgi:CelD/BcsL family acetyltransferase involved in cellulose biosynthesis
VERCFDSPSALTERLDAVQALYLGRKESRGGAGYDFDPAFVAMIGDSASSRPGRVRLHTIEREDEVIAAQLVLQAGRTALLWITAFDGAWGHLGPGVEVSRAAIVASAGTADVMDLSIGEFGYKADLRDRQEPVGSMVWCRPELRRVVFAFAASAGID